jgi:hypothetical protein
MQAMVARGVSSHGSTTASPGSGRVQKSLGSWHVVVRQVR